MLIATPVFGQFFDTVSLANKIEFVRYLQKNKQTEDAYYLLHNINVSHSSDSLSLMEVKLLLNLNQHKKADSLLQGLANTSKLSPESECRYTLIKNHIHLLESDSSVIETPPCAHTIHREVWRIQLLAKALLHKNTEEFDMIFNSGKNFDPTLSLIEFSLYVQKEEILRYPRKKKVMAGLISALLPGAGKLYAGKPHEALNAFLPVVFNGAQAAEGYYYKKFKSPHFYIFTSIGTVFYASNIIGSARAAARKNDEFYDRLKANTEFEIAKLINYY